MDPTGDKPDWRPTAGQDALMARAELLARIRRFFADRGVLEVETPVLSRAGNSDPGLSQLRLRDADFWLRTSPEYAMKRLLAAGSGDIYELGRVFRHEESGRHHNPEFTLLEWYRVAWACSRLWAELAELVNACGALFRRQWEVKTQSYRDSFLDLAGIDPFAATLKELQECAGRHRIDVASAGGLDHDGWLDLLFSGVVQNRLHPDALTIIHDFPASKAALARVRPGNPPLAERFEVFLGRVELANGYQELTDAAEQRARFEAENRNRVASGQGAVKLDENLLAALEAGLPECSGVALGVDRLLMACLGADHIDEVLGFPFRRA